MNQCCRTANIRYQIHIKIKYYTTERRKIVHADKNVSHVLIKNEEIIE